MSTPATTTTTTQYIRTADGRFQCPHCEKKCEKQNTMYYHIKKNHLQDFKFTCSHCPAEAPMRFIQKSAYLQHVATCHPDESQEGGDNPYAGVSRKCPCCDHTTHTKANMLVHFARGHCKDWIPAFTKSVEGTKGGCKGCNKDFSSSTAYLYHAIGCIKPISEDYANMISLIK